MSKSRKDRVDLTMHQRMEIIKKLERGATVQELCKYYNASRSTIYVVIRKAVEVSQYISQCGPPERKRLKKAGNEDLEGRLYSWLLERKVNGDKVTDVLIREKAMELNEELGGSTDFKGSAGWLSRFKARYNVKQLNIAGRKGDTDETAAKDTDMKRIVKEQDADEDDPLNLYNVDESGDAADTHRLQPLFIEFKEEIEETDDDTIAERNSRTPQNDSSLSEEEVEKMLEQLIRWSKDKPESIQLQAQSLKAYYYEQKHTNV